jgi:hypothetical protein
MSIELRLTVTEYFVWIVEANQPETRRNTYGRDILRTWDIPIADTKRHELSTQLWLTVAETIPSRFQANRPGVAWGTKSVEVNCNEFITRELEGSQSRHRWDLISYNPIEPIDDDKDDSRSHTATRVALPAMPKSALFQRFLRSLSEKCSRMRTIEPTQAAIAHPSAPAIIFLSAVWSAPREDQGRFTKYARFTSIHIADGSSNRDYLPHDSMESSTLLMMLGVYCSDYGFLMQWYNYEYRFLSSIDGQSSR